MTDKLRRTDIPIASYAHSGNTWVRYLLADVILQIRGFETDTRLAIHPDYIIPPAKPKRNVVDERIALSFQLVKTHDKFNPIVPKVVYLFRDPADTLCAYYYFHLRYREKVKDVDTFCLRRTAEWCRHLQSYMRVKDIPIWFISYERLHEDAVSVLLGVTRFLGLKVDREMAQIAVSNHTFEKEQVEELRWEAEVGKNYPVKFFREGKVGGAADKLKPSTLEHIYAECIETYLEARMKEKAQ